MTHAVAPLSYQVLRDVEGDFVQRLILEQPPAASLVYRVDPFPRPLGKPYGRSKPEAIERLRSQSAYLPKGKRRNSVLRRIQRMELWNRSADFVEAVKVQTMIWARTEHLELPLFRGPVFAVFDFWLPAPWKGEGPSGPVDRKPDEKNLRFAFEDALNPGGHTDLGPFPGLWVDDCAVHAFCRRYWFSREDREPGIQLLAWSVAP